MDDGVGAFPEEEPTSPEEARRVAGSVPASAVDSKRRAAGGARAEQEAEPSPSKPPVPIREREEPDEDGYVPL